MSLKETLTQKILTGNYKATKSKVWGGADTIYSVNPSEADFKNTPVVVKTPYVGAIEWLIEEVKPHLDVDYLSKYICYPAVGEKVKAAQAAPDATEQSVLLAMLEAFSEFFKPED